MDGTVSDIMDTMKKFRNDKKSDIPYDDTINNNSRILPQKSKGRSLRGPGKAPPKQDSEDFFKNPFSTILGSLTKDWDKLQDNKEFSRDIKNAVDELHTTGEWIEILNPRENHKMWIDKLDGILEEIELREDFLDYIVEMEKLREILKQYTNTLSSFPIAAKFGRYQICYFLELLRYGMFTRLSEYDKLTSTTGEESPTAEGSSSLNGDEKEHMVVSTVNKIMFTTVHIMMRTMSDCGLAGIFSKDIKPIKWGHEEENDNKLSKQAFIEFNEYLVEKDFFTSQKSESTECCIS